MHSEELSAQTEAERRALEISGYQISHSKVSSEAPLLRFMYQMESPTVAQLAQALNVSPNTVVARRKKLRSDGLCDGQDNHRYGWKVTPRGIRWLQRHGMLDSR